MAQNLFALSQTGASDANKPLIAFRAGKCTFANGTVTPINKKGLVQVLQTPDSLLHFQWKDRTTGTVEDDLIIFPEEAQFVKATPSARVLLLKFTSGRKLFFWLQEPKDDKDKEYEEKTNQYINNPPPPEQSAGASLESPIGGLPAFSGMDESQLRQMFRGVSNIAPNAAENTPRVSAASPTSQSTPPSTGPGRNIPTTSPAASPATSITPASVVQPAAPVNSSSASANNPTNSPSVVGNTATGPLNTTTVPPNANTPPNTATAPPNTATAPPNTATAPPNTATTAPTGGQDKLSAEMAASLSSILAGFGMPTGSQQGEDIDLQDVLLPEVVFPLLSGDSEALKELYNHLPSGTQNLAGLRELLFSAQFGQTIDAFTHVVNSGHANALMRMFGFDPMLAGPVGVMDVNGFISALQGSVDKNKK